MRKKRLSIIDIAKISGFSTATISRVLNSAGGYSEDTEKKVLEIVNKYNFKLNVSAKTLRTNQSRIIGIVVPDITAEFFSKIVRAVDTFFLEHKYSVFICDSNEESNENTNIEELHLDSFVEKNVDGIIYISGKNVVKAVDDRFSIPVVYIDRKHEDANWIVYSDNEKGGYLAGEHLVKKGCKKLLLLRSNHNTSPIRHRKRGFYKALEDYGINPEECIEVTSEPLYEDAKKTIEKVIKSGQKFDGIFTTNDMMALGTLVALLENGIEVPEAVKLVGFDDVSMARFCTKPITTIRQDTDRIGIKAAQTLLKIINKEEVIEKDMVIPVELIERETT